MTTKRLPTKDENGWPYCLACRKQRMLVLARADRDHPDQHAPDKSCDEHRSRVQEGITIEWKDFETGQPCTGCGQPYEHPWSGADKGTMYYTDEERAVHQAEEARYQAAHSACHTSRRLQGNLISHCVACCPMPPMTPELRKRVAPILRRILLDAAERQQAVE